MVTHATCAWPDEGMNTGRALLLSLLCTACPPAQHAGEAEPSATSPTTAAPSFVASASAVATASASGDPVAALPLEVQEHTLDAKVLSVERLTDLTGGVRPVDADPRFVVELELFGVAPAMADDPKGSALSAGNIVYFGVHSPARLFKSDADMTGKRMHFSVTRTRTKHGVKLSALHAE